MSRFPTAFAERNKVVIAVVGLTAMVLVFVATFNAAALPIIGGGTTHVATFAESGGIRPGDEVRIAGVTVGEVTDLTLDRDTVAIEFRLEDAEVNDQTHAAVKVETMLGEKYLSLDPAGRQPLTGPIPVAHTTTPYDVNAALSDLSTTVEEIDTEQLEQSMEVLTAAFEDTPESVRKMIDGLTALSRTISTRDEELAELFDATETVSRTLADRNEEFAKIIQDGSDLLAELERRRAAVQEMLRGTARLGTQVRGLVRDNRAQLQPALAKLDKVSAILRRNQENLEAAMEKLGPYYRVLASATGNGRWVDTYVCGLFDANQNPLLENDVKRNCHPGGN